MARETVTRRGVLRRAAAGAVAAGAALAPAGAAVAAGCPDPAVKAWQAWAAALSHANAVQASGAGPAAIDAAYEPVSAAVHAVAQSRATTPAGMLAKIDAAFAFADDHVDASLGSSDEAWATLAALAADLRAMGAELPEPSLYLDGQAERHLAWKVKTSARDEAELRRLFDEFRPLFPAEVPDREVGRRATVAFHEARHRAPLVWPWGPL